MKLFKTKQPCERLNVRRVKKGEILRIAHKGYSLHIKYNYIRLIISAVKWLLIIIGTFFLFRWGQAAAFAERGYKAYGGEMFILLVPLLWWLIERSVKDSKVIIKEIRRNDGDDE